MKGRNAVLCDTIAIHAQKQPEWMAAMFAATRFPNCSQRIVSYGCVTILLIYIFIEQRIHSFISIITQNYYAYDQYTYQYI